MQLRNVVEQLGEVNVERQSNGELKVTATFLLVPDVEFDGMGLALDASASMKKMYGISGLVNNTLFNQATSVKNQVQPVTRTIVDFLSNYSRTSKVSLVYWACSPDGSQIEEIGEFDKQDIQNISLRGPNPEKFSMGMQTKLLPPLKYFVDKFQSSAKRGVKHPAAICVFITDGKIDDLEEVKKYSFHLAQEISQNQKPFIKMFLLGVGEDIDEAQMTELDNLFDENDLRDYKGQRIDLWDHQRAGDMKQAEQVFKEMVSEDVIVIDSSCRIVNQSGTVCHNYSDGVPALLQFMLPPNSTEFTLEFQNAKVTQDISEALSQL
ncbi:vWA domain-containing protein [Nostoc sp. CALU 546]|uniref:vWA domain-containing protein n=1 Tax=Nostoc sp. CALU 546 TaxID=1867241 RepID=UPI003B684268